MEPASPPPHEDSGVVIITREQVEGLAIYDVYLLLRLNNGWEEVSDPKSGGTSILQGISRDIARLTTRWCPPKLDLFNPFIYTPYHLLKVVILGQDPYYQPGVAMGLSFSVRPGQPLTQSLEKIKMELKRSLGVVLGSGCLTKWAVQGVLLLNVSLTVEEHKPGSHTPAWLKYTPLVLKELSKRKEGLIFMLWGGDAKKMKAEIAKDRGHHFLECAHPVAEGRGKVIVDPFVGCDHFKKANELLKSMGKREVDWST